MAFTQTLLLPGFWSAAWAMVPGSALTVRSSSSTGDRRPVYRPCQQKRKGGERDGGFVPGSR